MADRIANALEKLVKGGGDVGKVADLLEQSCSEKSEKSSEVVFKTIDIDSYM